MSAIHFPLSILPKPNPLILDYLAQKEDVKQFYELPLNLESIGPLIEGREKFELDRKRLVQVLKSQYADVSDRSEVDSQIELLTDEKTFTVCTGHQLGLYGGPAYTFYKAATTIALSIKFQQKFPEYKFVPIFWLASEDHDFEEINNINLFGKSIKWNSAQSGAVGRMKLNAISEVKKELFEILGDNPNAAELKSIIDDCFVENSTLADATRLLIHNFFGDKGLVCIDPDDKKLKSLFAEKMILEVVDGVAQKAIEATNADISKNYKTQIHPREVNLFYLSENGRSRLTRNGSKLATVDDKKSWTVDEIKKEIEDFPENFSPNVAMRPLYQECILPNIAYIGGTGEIAYWLQLKNMFKSFAVPFPLLVPRNSIVWLNKKSLAKWVELGFEKEDLFSSDHELISTYTKSQSESELSLMAEKEGAIKVFENVLKKSHQIDKNLVQIVESEKQKLVNAIDGLEKKMLKAEKRKHGEAHQKISSIKNQIFPEGVFQERKVNFMEIYLKFGKDFLDKILGEIDPLASDVTLFADD